MTYLKTILFWLTLSLPGFADIPKPETLHDTLRLMQEAYLNSAKITKATIDFKKNQLLFHTGDGEEQIAFPDNLHGLLISSEDDAERESILLQFRDVALATIDMEDGVDIANVLPVIRHKDYGVVAGEIGKKPDPNLLPASLPFVADMRIFFVEDAPEFVRYVTGQDLISLKISLAGLQTKAAENLAARGWRPEVKSQGNIHFLALDGNYETSFMTDTKFWAAIDNQIGQIIAIVLARDLVVFTDADIIGAKEQLLSLTNQNEYTFNYPISLALLKWKDGHWHEERP